MAVVSKEPGTEHVAAEGARRGRPARRVVSGTGTVVAAALVLAALVVPAEFGGLTPGAFVRLPLEGLLGAALILALGGRAQVVAAACAGAALGLLTVLRALHLGFDAVLHRPFDPVLDWPMLGPAVDYLGVTSGRAAAVGAVALAVAGAVAVVLLTTLAAWHLTRVLRRHRAVALRGLAVAVAGWLGFAITGAGLVPGTPFASLGTARFLHGEAHRVAASLRDREEFAELAAADAFHGTPGEELLTALRGKDVVLTFVESYGRVALADPEFAPEVGAVLDTGTRRLREAGFAARSAFLTSPTAGGGSWLAHATLLSGLWVDNEQRYRTLVASDRFSLTHAFRRADWRTVGVQPAIVRAWPEGAYYGYDRVRAADDLGYRGPRFGYATMPDQYVLAEFERAERAEPDHGPLAAVIPLVSSHGPWTATPRLIGWDQVGDGSVFHRMPSGAAGPGSGADRDRAERRADYRRAVEYSLNTLISYVETHGDDDLVLVFVGDHQPAPTVTGPDAGHDVPITIVARDRAVLERISGWNWDEGLRPGPRAPVWRMDAFRDRFLTAFGPREGAPGS